MQEIAPEVIRFKSGISNVYIIQGRICIDSGSRSHPEKLIRNLEPKGKILITHFHYDHLAGAPRICRELGYTIHGYLDEILGLMGMHRAQGWIPRLIPLKIKLETSPWGLGDLAQIRTDSSMLKLIHTPGHTLGHACYLYRDLIFLGDLVRADADGNPIFIATPWTDWDPDLKRRSLIQILKYDFKLCCPGHGGLFERDRLMKLCSKLGLIR